MTTGLRHVTEFIEIAMTRTIRPQNQPKHTAQASMAFQAPPQPATQAASAPEPTGAFLGIPEPFSRGNLDLGSCDTTPGSGCTMAPPTPDLTTAQYLDLMRKRYATDPRAAQHMILYARRGTTPTGPHADQARAILDALAFRPCPD